MHEEEPTKQGVRPLMATTPGITEPNLSRLPLATEAEASPGPNDVNPYRSERERRITEQIVRQREERQRKEPQTLLGEPPGAWGTPITHDVPTLQFELLDSVQAFDPFDR